MRLLASLEENARRLKQHTLVVYFAARDRRTPLLVRSLALFLAAYALSPIDLIPDFIPVLGHLDDLVLLPLGLALVVKLTPSQVLESARVQAEHAATRPISYSAAVSIIVVWLIAIGGFLIWALSAGGLIWPWPTSCDRLPQC